MCRYQSTVMGSFQTVELIETFINYQESIKRCITIIYDPQRSALGGLAIKVRQAASLARPAHPVRALLHRCHVQIDCVQTF